MLLPPSLRQDKKIRRLYHHQSLILGFWMAKEAAFLAVLKVGEGSS